MAREVWFQLVQVSEDQQGMPFSGVSEDAVQLTDDIRDVRNLREAIREKYRHEKPDSMEGVAPNQLRIYANEAAYKAKKPCSPRSSLNDLDMRAIFIVEVRLQQPQRPVLEIPQVDWAVIPCSQLALQNEANRLNCRHLASMVPELAVPVSH
ncbi:hypothetical protein JG687_00006377 [Phytophthora cactorum]|uniref:Uncharacterized protein n=1 Tax=Phytophthora cactorum TaxID=29920 RepID=A0A8T1UL91_9STRA|nr:hypothetical protein JG687_00006377 [Phytophthora cactorum]